MSETKIKRNEKLIKMRDENPEKNSFGKIGKKFNINKITAYQIYKREKNKKTIK